MLIIYKTYFNNFQKQTAKYGLDPFTKNVVFMLSNITMNVRTYILHLHTSKNAIYNIFPLYVCL